MDSVLTQMHWEIADVCGNKNQNHKTDSWKILD